MASTGTKPQSTSNGIPRRGGQVLDADDAKTTTPSNGAPAPTGTPQAPQPLVALDPDGSPSLLSYNVPEPTSYTGRNFLEIPLPADAFTTIVNTATAVDVVAERDLGVVARPTLQLPPGTTVTDASVQDGVLFRSDRPLAESAQSLTAADLKAAADAGRKTVLYPNIAGELAARMLPGDGANLDDGGYPGGDYDVTPRVTVTMSAPAANASVTGPATGVTITASGRSVARYVSNVAVTVKLDDQAPKSATRGGTGTWSQALTVTKSGLHKIEAKITGTGTDPETGDPVHLTDTASASFYVTLDKDDTAPVVVLPSLQVTEPGADTTFVNENGVATATVSGTTAKGSGGNVTTVVVTDRFDGSTVQTLPDAQGNWSVEVLLDGIGRHDLEVTAVDAQGQRSLTTALVARVLAGQPLRRLKNRLMLVETLNLSSFLGAFGAGRVIKTFSLLPGEETTVSLKTWTKSADTRKSGSSIVDSSAREAADSFEEALSAEQTNSVAQSEQAAWEVGGTATATWGWGVASINANYSGSANAARSEAVKNIQSATRKHSMKASSNRSVTVNTEYTVSRETGAEESTTRKIANINASRTLNFAFRQMNQEHITLVHLTNVRVAYYTEDLALDAQGRPAYVDDPATGRRVLDIRRSYIEAPLPQLQEILTAAIAQPWQEKVRQTIRLALSGIPDYEDELHTVYETVTPTRDGSPVPEATYLTFPRHLKTDFVDPRSGQVITVPGIVLSYDHLVMRTEAVMVDSVLGQGESLDSYSQGLQQVTVAERRAAVAAQEAEVKKLQVALQLVEAGDTKRAAIYAQLFPPPAPSSEDGTKPSIAP